MTAPFAIGGPTTTAPSAYVTLYYRWYIPPIQGPIYLTIMLRNNNHSPETYTAVYLDNATLTPNSGSTCAFDGTVTLQVNQTCWASFTTYGNSKYVVRGYGTLHSMQFHTQSPNSFQEIESMVAGDACTYYSTTVGPECIIVSPTPVITETTQSTSSIQGQPINIQPVSIQVDTYTLALAIVAASVIIALGIVISGRTRKEAV